MKAEIGVAGLVAGAVGAFFGALLGYQIATKRYMDKLEADYENRHKGEQTETKTEEAETKTEENKEEPAKNMGDVSSIQDMKMSTHATAYSDAEDTSVDVDKDIPVVSHTGLGIEEITAEEYNDGSWEYDKKPATWYQGSRDLIDDDIGMPLDVRESIGLAATREWPKGGIRYIRNNDIGCDYKVTFVDDKWDPYRYD